VDFAMRQTVVSFPATVVTAVGDAEHFIVAGGGGAAKSGVPNGMALCALDGEEPTELSFLPFENRVTGAAADQNLVYCTSAGECTELQMTGKRMVKRHSFRFSDEEEGGRCVVAVSNTTDMLLITAKGHASLWKRSGQKIGDLGPEDVHTEAVKSATFSPDGSRAVTVDDKHVALWDVATRKLIAVTGPTQREGKFAGGCFSKSGRLVYVAEGIRTGGFLVKLTATNLSPAGVFRIVDSPVTSVRMSGDGVRLAVGTASGDLAMVNPAEPVPAAGVKAHDLGVAAVCFVQGGAAVVSASLDKTVSATQTTMLHPSQTRLFQIFVAFVLVIAAFGFVVARLV